MGELDDPVVVDFPLRGEWAAANTPAHRIPSHGTDMLGQRYAFDFVRIDHRKGFHLHPASTLTSWVIGGRTRDCYGWGQPVHAAFDGEVVTAADGVAERGWLHVVRELALVVKNAVTFDPAKGVTPVAGNHVVMRMNGAFAFYAHLSPGSVAVKQGDTVRTGELLGRVGHTGNSTAPHLHFQMMDSADPLEAKGIPSAFAAYEVERDGRWERVERGIPARRERIRSIS
ncbi:MAG TPA: M23 family metallopeptidase [Actinomycetota bacterium]|jgi:Peptidase family M23|nr:M23 family metallopeptidase [Actinomycetota bacterium]